MDYRAAVDWLNHFDNLERRLDPASWSRIRLERVERLLDRLGSPHRHGRAVHLAGTKGKGSVAAMTASILRVAGSQVGLYTSPHLISHRERIQVDGRPIPREALTRLVNDRLRPAVERYLAEEPDQELTFFDLHTALAFCWFEESKVDWSVVEVGLGGRLDATNVLAPEVTAITTISYDHTALLGHTLAEIAAEKAGIIKPGVPVVLGPQPPEARQVLKQVAAERGAAVRDGGGVTAVAGGVCLGDEQTPPAQRVLVDWPGVESAPARLPLLGQHQVENAGVARTIAELLSATVPRLDQAAVSGGFADVRWPGRLQVLGRRPWLILDGAHNLDSARRLLESLDLFPHQRRFLVFAAARDKDIRQVAAVYASGCQGVVTCAVEGYARSADPAELLPAFAACPGPRETASEPVSALAQALSWATDADLVLVTGSLYLVGAILASRQGPEPA